MLTSIPAIHPCPDLDAANRSRRADATPPARWWRGVVLSAALVFGLVTSGAAQVNNPTHPESNAILGDSQRVVTGNTSPTRASKQTAVSAASAVDLAWAYRCRADADAGSCDSNQLPQTGARASMTDYGIGGYTDFDGVTQHYVFRLTYANGARRTYFFYRDATCGPGQYRGAGVTLGFCGVSGWYTFPYPHQATGPFTLEVLKGPTVDSATVFYTASGELLPATIHKSQGDGQRGAILEPLSIQLGAILKDFNGVPVGFPVNRVNRPMTFGISGPGGANGMSVTESRDIPTNGSVFASATLGSKTGPYQITASHVDATPAVFTATAVTELPDVENSDVEEESASNNDPEDQIGDPITLTSGNNHHVETDVTATGISPIGFARSYNSLGVVSRVMGNGWTTTFDRYIMVPTTAGNPVRIRRPDGRTIRYSLSGGTYVAAPQFLGKLTQTATGWRYVDADQTIEDYDSQGRWKTITDLRGRITTAVWDSRSGRLTGVNANTGGSLTFAYNSTGRLQKVTDATGRFWTYTYNGYTNLTQVADPDGRCRYYSYQSPVDPHLLTGVGVGACNQGAGWPGLWDQVRWEYDSSRRATASYMRTSEIEVRERVDIAYGADGSRTVTDSLGRVSTYQTERAHNRTWLTTIAGPTSSTSGFQLNREYDAQRNVTASARFGSVVEFSGHDAKRQVGIVTRAAGTADARQTQITYDPRFIGRPTRIVEPSVAAGRSKVTTIDYDSRALPTRVAVAGFRPDGVSVSRVTNYRYEGPFGQLTEIDGPRTDVVDITRLAYSASNNRVVRVTDANGIIVRNNLTYTPTGKIATEDRPNGLRLTYAYYSGSDLLKSVTETSGTVNHTTTWVYSDRRFVASITVNDGVSTPQVMAFTYDASGKLKSVASGSGSIEYTLDSQGKVSAEKAFSGGTTLLQKVATFTHDTNNRLDRIINPNNSMDVDHAADGRLERSVDGRGQTTTYQYDELKRLTKVIEPGSVATEYAYDVQDRLIRVTDANLAVTRYDFDDLGNRLRVESPDTGVSTAEHNAAGQVTQSTDAKGQVTAMAYDAGGRIMSIDRAGTQDDEVYVYDSCTNGSGRLCRITSGNGETVAFEYDGFGNVSKVTTPAGTIAMQHNASGAVTRLTYPSGRSVLYDYNTGGQVTRVRLEVNGVASVLADQVTHVPFGPVTGWRYGNGLQHTRTVDQQYWPRNIGTTGVSTLAYPEYDGNGNPTSMTVDGQAQLYSYSPQNRLSTAVGPWGNQGFDHDDVGNRTLDVKDSTSTSYTYAPHSNRLDTDSRFDWTLDPNGNTTEKRAADGTGQRFDYSAHNRLVGISELASPANPSAVYRYNALGQRTQKSTGSQITRFVYNLTGQLLTETGGGAIVQEYVWLEGLPLALLGQPTAAPPPSSYEQIVDNGAPDDCWVNKNDQKAYGGKYLQCDPDIYTNWPSNVWHFPLPVAGEYEVQVWFISRDSASGSWYTIQNYPQFLVSHAGLTRGTWVSIGTYSLNAGVNRILLRAGSADAMKVTLRRATVPAANINYVHTDHLGTPRAVTDGTGRKIWSASFAPFGTATINDDVDGDGVRLTLNLRFPGQYFDAESGLHYNYFRTYDPSTGRYLESDPIGLEGGLNTYAYALLNPISGSDSSGLATNRDINLGIAIIQQNWGLPNRPASVTMTPGLSDWFGNPVLGATDYSGNIQLRADSFGDINTPVDQFVAQQFLETLAHEMYHANQGLVEQMMSKPPNELHAAIQSGAEHLGEHFQFEFLERRDDIFEINGENLPSDAEGVSEALLNESAKKW